MPRLSSRLAAGLLALSACGRGDREREAEPLRVVVDTVPVAAPPAAGAGVGPGSDPVAVGTTRAATSAESTTITTTDQAVTMALVGDRVVVRLSDQALTRVRGKLAADSGREPSGSLGGSIERMVKSAVEETLSRPVEYALDEIEDVRYEGGAIRFDFRGRRDRLVEQVKMDDRPLLESFAPADAQRFVAAVRAAKSTAR
jgi:hypothetical protein